MTTITVDFKERMQEIAYELMKFSNELHDNYSDNKFIVNNIWKALSFYSMDLIEKSKLLGKESKNENN